MSLNPMHVTNMPLIKKLSTLHKPKSGFARTKWQAGIILAVLTAVSMPAYACTIPKSYYKHVSCTANSRYFLAVKDSGAPVALIGRNGKRVVDLMRYSQVDVSKLKGGLLPVQRAGKVGYVNMSGREVIPAIYDVIIGDRLTSGWARAANNNRIIVKKNGKFGIISTSNKVILPFASKYKTISDYESGTAKVYKSNQTLLVDSNARKIKNADTPVQASQSTRPASQTPRNATASEVDRTPESVATVQELWQPKERNGKWGFVNSEDVPMITFSFDEVMPFSEGLAAVRMDNTWGFVNLAGSLVIPFRFDELGIIRSDAQDRKMTYLGVPPLMFKDGKAWIGNLTNGRKLCIDKEGINVECDGANLGVTSSSLSKVKPVGKVETIESQIVDNTTIDDKAIENRTVENVQTDNNIIGNRTITSAALNNQPIENIALDNSVINNNESLPESATTPYFELRKVIKPKVYAPQLLSLAEVEAERTESIVSSESLEPLDVQASDSDTLNTNTTENN